MRISGCNDCNKVIDCKATKFPQNGVEKLVGEECFVRYFENGDYYYDYGEDYYGNYYCEDKCIGTDEEVPCACGKMVYKGGRAVPGQDLAANGITCYKTNTPVGGRALPLFKSSALVRMDLSTQHIKYHVTSLIS